MICPKCKADNPDDNQYCGKCGTSLIFIPDTPSSISTEALDMSKKLALEFAPGQYFSKRYQIIEEIGRGGMGRVYKAVDKELNRIVALKMIRPELSDTPAMVERFKKGLILASKVTHKNVCRIHDLGEVEGIKFISMQYIDGQDLKQFIQQAGKLTEEKALAIANQICEALQEVHNEGVIHRDLKPQNIVLDRKGNAYVMDFGFAKSVESRTITKPGVVMGTPNYMSPEQAKGKAVDHRVDVYSLGVIMYEMLTGNPPFKADSVAGLIHKHIKESPKPPSELNPQISKTLEEIILKCLEKKPEKRYQRADEIKKAIAEAKAELISVPRSSKTHKKQKSPLTEWKNSIAVLPFVDLSPEKDQEYFCDGLAEELINSLTKIKELRVVARSSSFSFKGKDLDIRQIGKRLNAETVLEGSVRKAGKRLRIMAQLIDVADGYHLWSERYDREMGDVFAIQDEISLEIINKMKIGLGVKEKSLLTRRYTDDLEAYNLYLKGRYHLNKRTEEGLQRAYEYFNQTMEKNPSYSLAYAGIADYYTLLGWFRYLHPKDAFPKAKAAAEKALEMDETLAEAHTSLAWVKTNYDWDWLAAEREYRRAIELKPSYATAHQWYSNYLGAMGRHDESIAEAKQAQQLDPLSLYITFNLGNMFYLARQYDQAIEECQKTLEMDPNFIVAHIFLPLPYSQKGKYKEAMAALKKAKDFLGEDNPRVITALGNIYALSGKKNKAKKVLDELHELSTQSYVSPWGIALIYVALGENDEAFQWLKKAYNEREQWMKFVKIEPLFNTLHSDPMFTALLNKMNL